MTDQHHAHARSDVVAAAEAAHRALDAADDGWHLACLQPDDDGTASCFKGHAARQMLVMDMMPAVLDALVDRGWTPPAGQVPMVGYPSRPVRYALGEAAR